MKTVWIATYIDTGDTCDGKPRVLAICTTEDEARAKVMADMQKWADDHADEGIEVDYSKMSAHYDYDSSDGCEWNLEKKDLRT